MDLAKGMQKYGCGEWSKMLKEPTFKFHCTPTLDKLKKRADSKTFKCKFYKFDVQWNLVVKNGEAKSRFVITNKATVCQWKRLQNVLFH